jgi:hypothetical protein
MRTHLFNTLSKPTFGALAGVIVFTFAMPAASACLKQSPTHKVALLELYTSEGCDSCPPANEWLGVQAKQFTTDQLVPIALHVDYWDYIGWKDRFANTAFGQRHRATVHANGGRTVYTPELFVGGSEVRDWRQSGALAQRVQVSNAQTAAATIRLEASANQREAKVKAQFKTSSAGTQAYIAVLEDKLVTKITRGENAGTTLKEERVVRHWLGPYALNSDTTGTVIERSFSLPSDSQIKHLSLAAFVQQASTGAILQATATEVGECF